jgi:hypothetical protein
VIQSRFEPFVEKLRIHQLPGGIFYKVLGAPSIGTANRLMEQVRRYRV